MRGPGGGASGASGGRRAVAIRLASARLAALVGLAAASVLAALQGPADGHKVARRRVAAARHL
eukprot:5325248-Prymnesium_polylepis.1